MFGNKSNGHANRFSPPNGLFLQSNRCETVVIGRNEEKEFSDTSSTDNISLYARQHCNLTGVDEWMPSDWRQRIPAFIIIGVKKGGTTGLFHTLTSHPQILAGRTKELQYFIPNSFGHWDQGVVGNPVQVAPARRELYEQHFSSQIPHLQQHSDWIAGEATPDYLIFPDFAAQAILCTIPWVKLIVMLRDPIDRLFSHYNYLKDPRHMNRKNMPTFEQWVMRDINVLQKAGVLPQNLSNVPEHMKSHQEREGWKRYQILARPGQTLLNEKSIGADRHFSRSLYAPQLEEWKRQLDLFLGKKSFESKVRIVLSRDILTDCGQQVANELMLWLGVNPLITPNGNDPASLPRRSMITHYTSPPIRHEFRQWLHSTIFVHYNQRLYDFLGLKYQGLFDDRSGPQDHGAASSLDNQSTFGTKTVA